MVRPTTIYSAEILRLANVELPRSPSGAEGENNSFRADIYRGKTNIKADNGIKYRCLQLSYMEKEDNDFKRIVDFYVTDDLNHVPVRLDMFLRFGSAKAFLIGMNGTRNPINSIVK